MARFGRIGDRAEKAWPRFTSVAFSPDGALALAGCDRVFMPAGHGDGQPREPEPWWWKRGVRRWRLSDKTELDLIRHERQVTAVSVSSDGEKVFTAGNMLTVWSLEARSAVWEKASDPDNVGTASPDGRYIARGIGYKEDNHGPYVNTALELFDGNNGEMIGQGRHRTVIVSIAFS